MASVRNVQFQERAEVVLRGVEQIPGRDLQEQEGGRQRDQAQAGRLRQARTLRNNGKSRTKILIAFDWTTNLPIGDIGRLELFSDLAVGPNEN